MDKSDAEKRIKKLRSEIARLRTAYHVKDTPNVTDDVYDSLTRELKIYNRGGLPAWLVWVLGAMAVTHVGTVASLFYILHRLSS